MAFKPNAQACANLAMDEVDGDFIPYVLGAETLDGRGADCQGFIEAVVRKLGGVLSVRGSNDMIRNACDYVLPLKEAKLQPGCVLFIVRQDGNEPEQYKGDGIGNASHVGWYTGGRHEVVHASASNGKVAPSTIRNGWTHAGWLKEVDYGEAQADPAAPTLPAMTVAYIDLPADENVFHRISPKAGSKWWGRIRGQEQVELVSVKDGWARVRYGGHDGYVKDEFVVRAGCAPVSPTEPVEPLDNTYLIPYIEAVETALTALKTALGDR